jgi:hypothetical protein
VGRLLFQLHQYFTRCGDFNARKDFPIHLLFSSRKDFTIRLIISTRKDFTIRLIFSTRKDFTGRKYLYIFPVFYFFFILIKYAPIFYWRNYFRPLGLRLIIVVMIIYCIYDYY